MAVRGVPQGAPLPESHEAPDFPFTAEDARVGMFTTFALHLPTEAPGGLTVRATIIHAAIDEADFPAFAVQAEIWEQSPEARRLNFITLGDWLAWLDDVATAPPTRVVVAPARR